MNLKYTDTTRMNELSKTRWIKRAGVNTFYRFGYGFRVGAVVGSWSEALAKRRRIIITLSTL